MAFFRSLFILAAAFAAGYFAYDKLLLVGEPQTGQEPVSEVVAEPEVAPEPEVVPEPEPEVILLSEDELIAVMQASVKSDAVTEFEFDSVKQWNMGQNETIDGVDYQVGFIVFSKETIFGAQPIDAKALITAGSVVKWIYVQTGEEVL